MHRSAVVAVPLAEPLGKSLVFWDRRGRPPAVTAQAVDAIARGVRLLYHMPEAWRVRILQLELEKAGFIYLELVSPAPSLCIDGHPAAAVPAKVPPERTRG